MKYTIFASLLILGTASLVVADEVRTYRIVESDARFVSLQNGGIPLTARQNIARIRGTFDVTLREDESPVLSRFDVSYFDLQNNNLEPQLPETGDVASRFKHPIDELSGELHIDDGQEMFRFSATDFLATTPQASRDTTSVEIDHLTAKTAVLSIVSGTLVPTLVEPSCPIGSYCDLASSVSTGDFGPGGTRFLDLLYPTISANSIQEYRYTPGENGLLSGELVGETLLLVELVPEPSSGLCLAVGLALALCKGRRRT